MASILVVDDFPEVHTMIKQMVEMEGHCVVGKAFNSNEAQELYERLKPDLVLLDLVLPGESGAVCLENILKNDPQARIIVVTGASPTSNVYQAACDAGAAQILHKPFRSEELKGAVDKVLATKTAPKK